MSARRPKINSSDVELPENKEVDLASNIDTPEVAIAHAGVDNKLQQEYLAELAFMEEELVILINLSDDPNAEDPVPCGNNGSVKFLKRGEPHKIKRKYLDSIIKTRYRVVTENYKDKDNVDQTRVRRIPSQVYPISILDHGINPERSQRWFMYRTNEAI